MTEVLSALRSILARLFCVVQQLFICTVGVLFSAERLNLRTRSNVHGVEASECVCFALPCGTDDVYSLYVVFDCFVLIPLVLVVDVVRCNVCFTS